ncbi:MAG: hypothetical protein WCC12_03435 [Anaerolineales bacterium]
MLRKEDFAVIEALNKRGLYLKDIAAEVEGHPNIKIVQEYLDGLSKKE